MDESYLEGQSLSFSMIKHLVEQLPQVTYPHTLNVHPADYWQLRDNLFPAGGYIGWHSDLGMMITSDLDVSRGCVEPVWN